MTKQNCWEFTNCGREPGGSETSIHGVCPTTTDTLLNGVNGGKNGGRICWAVVGTFCNKKEQNTRRDKQIVCPNCDFYQKVKEEEGHAQFTLLTLFKDIKLP